MKTIFQNRWLIFSLRLILGVIFIVASISKIQDITKFVSTVISYGILPDNLAHFYSYVAPWVELFIGCALILGVFVRLSAAILIPLIVSFMIASSYAIVNATGGTCGCFGTFLTLSYPVALTIDVLMLFASLILLFNNRKTFLSIEQLMERIHIKSRILKAGSRLALVGLVTAIIGFGFICIHNSIKRPEQISETVNIPAPLASSVDAVLSQHKTVLMEFYADGCSLCQAAAPIIYDMEQKFSKEIVVLRLDYRQYYQNAEVVTDLSLKNIPTVLVITSKNSDNKYTILGRFEGVVDRNALRSSIENAVKN